MIYETSSNLEQNPCKSNIRMKVTDIAHIKKCIYTLDRAWHLSQPANPASSESRDARIHFRILRSHSVLY